MVIIALASCYCVNGMAQEIPVSTEQQIEQVMHMEEINREDEDRLTLLEPFKKNPIHLNKAEAKDLQELGLLTDLQVQQFLIYRKWLGDIIDIYELQSIPTWNPDLIRALLPYVTIKSTLGFTFISIFGISFPANTTFN